MKIKATTANSLSNEKTEDITISELFEYWLMAEKDGSDISKPRNFFLYYKSYLAEPFGKRKVNDISHEEWKEYKQKLSNTHDTWEDEITAAISQRILDSFGKAFSYGHKEFGLNNPNVRKQRPLPDSVTNPHNRNTVKAAMQIAQQKQQQRSIEKSKNYVFSAAMAVTYNTWNANNLYKFSGAGQTVYEKVTVRLWLEGEDTTCKSSTYAELSNRYKLNLKFEIVGASDVATKNVDNIGSAITGDPAAHIKAD